MAYIKSMRANVLCRTTLKYPRKESSEKRIVLRRLKKKRSFKESELPITEIRKKSHKFNIVYSEGIYNLNFYKTWGCKYINMMCIQTFYDLTINVKYYIILVSLPLKWFILRGDHQIVNRSI